MNNPTNTAPAELNDDQWAAILAEMATSRTGDQTIGDFTEVESVLNLARDALVHLDMRNPLHSPALAQIAIWDTSDDNNADLFITVHLSDSFRLASELIEIETLRAANDTPGEPVIRLVINELLSHRNQAMAALAAMTSAQETGVVLTHEQLEEWAGCLLSPADIEILDNAIPHSNIPQDVSQIVEGFKDRRD